MSSQRPIFQLMCDVFNKAQEMRTSHEKCIAMLSKVYKRYDFDEFYEAFEKCLKIPLSYIQKERVIENALAFAASFAVKLTPEVQDDDDEISPFLERIFEFILEKHQAKMPGIRYRICYFLNLILNSMGDDAYLNDRLCNAIIEAMRLRLKDKSSKVRIQAVYALHRMQEPGDNSCDVITSYLYHLSYDPSPEVRKAVIKNIGLNNRTVKNVVKRIKDVDDSVRKMAYLFLCKVTTVSLKMEQRRDIMQNGLQDKKNDVVKVVKEMLLSTWLSYYDYDITKLLFALDTELYTDIGILILKALFQIVPIDDLIKQLPLNPDTKLIPIDKLTSENVLYWRCFAQYLQESSYTDLFDHTLPELSYFSDHIKQYIQKITNCESSENEEITRKAILYQLFEITKLYDLSDEVGRNRLKSLIEDTLMSEIPDVKLTETIVQIYEKVVPNVTSRVNTLTHIISDIRMPLRQSDDINLQSCEEEKNDTYTMSKCLGIMNSMLKSTSVNNVTPIIRTLFNNVALPSIEHSDENVQVYALNAVGLCLFLDSELAKKHIPMFFMVFTESQRLTECWVISLTVIFDLFLKYGLDHFELMADDNNQTKNNDTTLNIEASQLDTPNHHVIKMLLGLIHYEVPEIQLTATEGFIKLLLMGRINSVQIVSHLILLLHNPVYENQHQLREVLLCFFQLYPLIRENTQEILEKTFFTTMRDIFDAPDDSNISNIDPCLVARFIFDLTRYKIYKNDVEDKHYRVHNRLSLNILKECINPDSEYDFPTLVKILHYVDIKITDKVIQNEMIEMSDIVYEELTYNHKILLRNFKIFQNKIRPGEPKQNLAPEEPENHSEEDKIEDNSDNE